MSDPSDLFSQALGPEAGTAYRLSRALAELFPGKAVVEGLTGPFDLDEFAAAGRCEVRPREGVHGQFRDEWSRAHGISRRALTAAFDVTWDAHALVVARAEWPEGYHHEKQHWVVADDRATAEAFAVAVSAHCNEPHDAVLVFNGQCWSKSASMWAEVQAASFDDLVLAGSLSEEIREDFATFLAAREEYARYRVPWKRGVLFTGPPGNGKTHCLRATVRFLGVPCLYVQSLKAKYEPDDANIARVFERAREVSPCCLVFEDLDAMITPQNRSTFLNQLDGFADASGLLTLATTNHPEQLDPAILERPSRFDRRYAFALPGPAERARYLGAWNARLDEAMRVSDEEQRALVAATEGFSFAYLKELFLSSMLRWMKARQPGGMAAILRAQLATLSAQMAPSRAAPLAAEAKGVARSVASWVDRNVLNAPVVGR